MKTSPVSPIHTIPGGAGKVWAITPTCPASARQQYWRKVRKHGYVLTPGRYVGAEAQEDDGEPFEDKMKRLVSQLKEQQTQGARLDAAIAGNLKALGFGDGES